MARYSGDTTDSALSPLMVMGAQPAPTRPLAAQLIPRDALEIEPSVEGRGGFGEVRFATWRGAPAGTSTSVAVKSMPAAHAQALAVEIEFHSRLQHESIVRAHGYVELDQCWALVMERMATSTEDRYVGRPPAALTSKLRVLADAASGLAYLHDSFDPPILHLDVKAANILLNGIGRGKLADFGLSGERAAIPPTALLGGTDACASVMASARARGGTPGFMAPEVLRSDPPTRRTDVYAFGVTMWEVGHLAGHDGVWLLGRPLPRLASSCRSSRRRTRSTTCGRAERSAAWHLTQ